ncbi:MAG: hypothetical protein L0387_11780 [Acidobacteria bacterium]|nr:hypothetical protein [Acidobacteriota bacterium]MCI0622323.1 hypothetical protein [Acidobacteriota bacterium]MCI0719349.1 hypothetical protein [Acidobacteriota bacterium]
MNIEKQKNNILQAGLEEEENLVPTRSRNRRILGRYVKIRKAVLPSRRRSLFNLMEPRRKDPPAQESPLSG